MGTKALDPLDLYDIRSELSEEELMVRDTVARFVDDRVIPVMREADSRNKRPVAEALRNGPVRITPFGVTTRGRRRTSPDRNAAGPFRTRQNWQYAVA